MLSDKDTARRVYRTIKLKSHLEKARQLRVEVILVKTYSKPRSLLQLLLPPWPQHWPVPLCSHQERIFHFIHVKASKQSESGKSAADQFWKDLIPPKLKHPSAPDSEFTINVKGFTPDALHQLVADKVSGLRIRRQEKQLAKTTSRKFLSHTAIALVGLIHPW